jgi:glutamate racemase
MFEGQDVENLIAKYVNPLVAENIDQLVLGCTHYPLFKNLIQKIAGENVNLLDSGEAVARRTKDVLMLNKIFNNSHGEQTIKIYSSKSTGALFYVTSKLFNVGEKELNVEIVKLS